MTDRQVRYGVVIVFLVLTVRLLDAAFSSGMWLEFWVSVFVLAVTGGTIVLALRDEAGKKTP